MAPSNDACPSKLHILIKSKFEIIIFLLVDHYELNGIISHVLSLENLYLAANSPQFLGHEQIIK